MGRAQKGSLSAHTNAVATPASGDDGGARRRAPRRRRRRRVAAAAARAPVRRRRRRRRRRARARAGPLRRRVVVPRDLRPAVLPGRRQKTLRASAARPGGRALPRRQRPRPPRRAPPPPRRRRRRHARALPARRGAGGARAADRGGAREGRRPELRRRAHLARAHEEHRAQGELAPGEGRGDGAERRTFLYYQDVGSVGPLLDAAQQLPSPLLAANTWSRPYAFGWQLPQPAIPVSLRSNLTVSDAWLLITDEAAPSAGQRADLFLRLLALLLPKVRLPFLSDHEGCFATSSGSF